MNRKRTRMRKTSRPTAGPRAPRRAVGYRPLGAAPIPALIHAAVLPIGRLPNNRAVVCTQEE